MNRLVSITMSTHDRPELLVRRSIPSVLAQSHPHWKLLIRGDGADEATAAAIAGFGDPRISYRNQPRRTYDDPREQWCVGGAHALNAGLDEAQGEFVAHLDDDDEMLPHHLESLIGCLDDTEADLAWGTAYRQLPECWVLHGCAWEERGRRGNPIVHSAVLYRRDGFGDLRYDESGAEPADYRMWQRLIAAGARPAFLPRPVVAHHMEGRQVERVRWEVPLRRRLGNAVRVHLLRRYRGWPVVKPPSSLRT